MNNKRQSVKSSGLIFVCKSVKVCAPHMWGDSRVCSASNDWHHQSLLVFSKESIWSFWLWSADSLGQSHNRHRLAIKIHLAGNVCMLRINVLLDILLIYGLSTYGAMTAIVYLIWMWNPTNTVKAKSQLVGFPVRMYCWDRCIIGVYFFTHCSNLYAFLNTYYHTQGHTGMFVIVLKEPPTPKPCDT